jgi:hypothetical protein
MRNHAHDRKGQLALREETLQQGKPPERKSTDAPYKKGASTKEREKIQALAPGRIRLDSRRKKARHGARCNKQGSLTFPVRLSPAKNKKQENKGK